METKGKIVRILKEWDPKSFLIFAIVAAIVFVAVNFFDQYLSRIAYIVLILEIAFIVTFTWGLAVHSVIKSLFGVGAGLSLLIFLAQSYCDVPAADRIADDALRSLLVFGFSYIGIEFCVFLYKEARSRLFEFKNANNNRGPWLVLIPYAAFTGLFVWQVVQVLAPIIENLCIV